MARLNAGLVTGTLSGTGVGNASAAYQFRGDDTVKGLRIRGESTNTTDAIQVVLTQPGQALSANTAAKITNVQGNAVFPVGPITVPFSLCLDSNLLGGAVDLYVYATTQ